MKARRRGGPVLLEREGEIASIEAALSTASAGGGAGLLLSGPPGIGKTALLEHARSRAFDRGMLVLGARGGLFEREFPFGVARQLLDRIASDEERREALFAGAAGAAAPLLSGKVVQAAAPDAVFGATYGLFWAIMNLAAQCPLLVCVDDLQWADEPSARLLDYLLWRNDDAQMAVVAALRTGEARTTDHQRALGELEAAGRLVVVEPAPLTGVGAAELARQAFGDAVEPGFASQCRERTGGNPFYLVELFRELADEGIEPTTAAAPRAGSGAPRVVARVVLARLSRLGRDAEALARAVATLGDGAQLADAAELGGLSRARASAAVEQLAAAAVLGDADGGLRFFHPLMRDAVEADMTPAVVGDRHAQAADILAQHGRSAEAVAAHALMSPPVANPTTVERLQIAARLAMGRAAPEEAATLLSRALAEPPRPEAMTSVLFDLGASEAAAHRPEATGHLLAARDRASPGQERAGIALLLARLFLFAGRSADVYATTSDVGGGLDPSNAIHRELCLMLEATRLTAGSMDPNADQSPVAWAGNAEDLPGVTPGERALLACLAMVRAKRAEPIGPILDMAERAILNGGDVLNGSDPFTPLMLVTVLQWSGRLEQASTLTTALMDQARTVGSSMVFSEAVASRAMTNWRAGRLAEAEADARQAMEAESMVADAPSMIAVGALTRTLVDRGDLDEAYAVASAYQLPPGREDLIVQEILLTSLGRVELAMGRHEDTLIRLTQAGAITERAQSVNPTVSEWRVLSADALIALGRYDQARDVLAPALHAARRSGGPIELASTLRVAGLSGVPVDCDLLAEALSVLEGSELKLERAHVLVDLGATLRRAGSRRDARAPLAEGMDLAARCGAGLLVDRARTELLAAGARPRTVRRTGLDALTPSEHRVARFASQGRSNREIAQELFVSSRTVEAHLRSAYSKLGVASRSELSRLLESRAEGSDGQR